MLDELRRLFLAALICDNGGDAEILIGNWNEAISRVQEIFNRMTSKVPTIIEAEEVKHE